MHESLFLRVLDEGLWIRGIPIPLVSTMVIPWSDIDGIEVIQCSAFNRLHFWGPDLVGRWWGFDLGRTFRRQALSIKLNRMFGFCDELVVTTKDVEAACQAIRMHLSQFRA